jgi:hypothetical protein
LNLQCQALATCQSAPLLPRPIWSAITPPYSNNAFAVLLKDIGVVLVPVVGGGCNNDNYYGLTCLWK